MYENDEEKEKFYLVRPLLNDMTVDEHNMPVIKAVHEKDLDIERLVPINFQNLRKNTPCHDNLILNFRKDKDLEKHWTNTLRYVPLFTGCAAVCTPDFSISPQMPKPWFDFLIFRSRYIGAIWQHYNIKVIPAVQWCYADTFDVCFSGIEPGGVVVVSALGAKNNPRVFLEGFNAMKKRLHPELMIVYGDFIDGMSGRFLHIKYKNSFDKKNNCIEQIPLFPMEKIFTRGESKWVAEQILSA